MKTNNQSSPGLLRDKLQRRSTDVSYRTAVIAAAASCRKPEASIIRTETSSPFVTNLWPRRRFSAQSRGTCGRVCFNHTATALEEKKAEYICRLLHGLLLSDPDKDITGWSENDGCE
ncbi:hypothetical protein B0T26DRAFT_680844 [Lasiosphaeria miniovina]|uniref:Uncharacterized protein n=1 Tax=Lasiosphaeria miniovina TaxID=1954250 RepID=A0AA40DJK2_9PEZI|nr:uncharacterized protein B0T26DRAFT_680844 [Lasiosphaeria miniovina]KAK0703102.1 hypothetical protein B0T26DRAFT_680844 [Lasiosphaeria miniovina]